VEFFDAVRVGLLKSVHPCLSFLVVAHPMSPVSRTSSPAM
jgi:hypothetical protein